MLRLEITGTTPDELYMNVVRTLSLMLKGAATSLPAEPANDAPSAPVAETPQPPSQAATTADAGGAAAEPEKPKRGPKKGGKAAEAKSPELNDEVPDLAAKSGEATAPKQYTLDGDIRPRLREIQKAHAERGNDMPTCIAYIQKLYGPFGIAKADQLKPEQYAEFMDASDAYLKGEA